MRGTELQEFCKVVRELNNSELSEGNRRENAFAKRLIKQAEKDRKDLARIVELAWRSIGKNGVRPLSKLAKELHIKDKRARHLVGSKADLQALVTEFDKRQ
jgi:hypothetical protein